MKSVGQPDDRFRTTGAVRRRDVQRMDRHLADSYRYWRVPITLSQYKGFTSSVVVSRSFSQPNTWSNHQNKMITQTVVNSMLYHKLILPIGLATQHNFFKVGKSRS
jgi:hypothetical protein